MDGNKSMISNLNRSQLGQSQLGKRIYNNNKSVLGGLNRS